MKLKIILFGATDKMFQTAMDCIKEDNCEIVAFCDNDKYKQGLVWNCRKILSVNQVAEMNYDFIIICAWYSYNQIKNNLLNVGIPSEKILPLLSIRTIMLLIEPINIVDENILSRIFRDDPKRLNDKIMELNKVIKNYSKISPLNTLNVDTNFNDYPLVAHAGGGMIENKKLMYTNSLEAFETSIKSGFKMFEFDVYGLLDDDILFGHDYYIMDKLMLNYYTPAKFTDILSTLSQNPTFRVMLDVKWNTLPDYVRILDKMDSILNQKNSRWCPAVKNQLFVQVYNRETIECAVNHGWKCLLTNYRNFEGTWFLKSALLCCEFGVSAVMIGKGKLFSNVKYLKFLKEKKVPIISYSVDDIDEYINLKKLGIVSMLTNFMKPYDR